MFAQYTRRAGVVVVALVCLGGTPATGQPQPPPATPPTSAAGERDDIPLVWADPAFARYLDAEMLRDALTGGDAAALADCAFLLAEGERVLHRPHRAVKADAVFALAVRTAADTRDAATLDRLAAAAKPAQKEVVEAARKLATASRAAAPAGLSQDAQETYRGLADGVATAARLGDADLLARVREAAAKADLPAPAKAQLGKLAADAAPPAPDAADADGEMLRKLAGSSRGILDDVSGNSKFTVTITNAAKMRLEFDVNGSRHVLNSGQAGTYTGKCRGKCQVSLPYTSGLGKYSVDSGKSYRLTFSAGRAWLERV